MAELNKTATVTVNFVDKTTAGIASLSKGLDQVGKSTGGLSNGLAALGIAGAALWAGGQLLSFFGEAGKLAEEDALAVFHLKTAIESFGISVENVTPQLESYRNYMLQFGQTVGETDKSIAKLVRTTGSVESAMALSKIASDAAAAGVLDLESATSALAGMFNGKYKQAAAAFGIDMRENTTAGEVFDQILKKVKDSTEKLGETTEGQTKAMKGNWEELKGQIGKITTNIVGTFATMVLDIEKQIKRMSTDYWIPFSGISEEIEAIEARTAETWLKVNENRAKKELEKKNKDLENAEASAKLADSLKQSFRDVSKAVVSAVSDQEKAIDALRKTQKQLSDQLSDSLEKSDSKFKQDAIEMARTAKERIDDINKEIETERQAQNQGWRSKIAKLEEEKAKEQAIIDKAGGVVVDIGTQIAKDEFDVLQEKHQKEIEEIKKQNEEKKSLVDQEIAERIDKVKELQTLVGGKDFYAKAGKEGTTFAGAIGAGGVQNVIQFTFNGDVSDIETLKKQVVESLNRTALLKQVGAK